MKKRNPRVVVSEGRQTTHVSFSKDKDICRINKILSAEISAESIFNCQRIGVLFFLRRLKSEQHHLNSIRIGTIYCRIYANGSRSKGTFTTGITVAYENWDSKKQRIIGDGEHTSHLNDVLFQLKARILEVARNISNENPNVLPYDIRAILSQKSSNKDLNLYSSVKKLIELYIEERKSLWRIETIKQYQVYANNIFAFIDKVYNDKPLSIRKTNRDFADKYIAFAQNHKNHKRSYINKTLHFLKSVFIWAYETDRIKENYLKGVKLKKDFAADIICLDDSQILLLATANYPKPYLQRTADLFLFACFTGLRYSDLASFGTQNIITDSVGNEWIHKIQVKTQAVVRIPLLPEAKVMLNKYAGILPIISNQKYNAFLKIVAEIAGLNVRLTSHVARKTFGTLLRTHDVPIDIVSKLLGHRNIKQTENTYVKVSDKTIVKAIEKFELSRHGLSGNGDSNSPFITIHK